MMVDSDVFIVASDLTWIKMKWNCTKRVIMPLTLIAVMIATTVCHLLTIRNTLMLTMAFKTQKYGKDYQNSGVLSSAQQIRQTDEHCA